jgi:hypothetical protein
MRGEDSFLDADHWKDLAREFGIRLPRWDTPCSTSKMKWYLSRIGVTPQQYLEYHNEKNFLAFQKYNPDWPLRAWVGVELELAKHAKEREECQAMAKLSGPVLGQPSKRARSKTSS